MGGRRVAGPGTARPADRCRRLGVRSAGAGHCEREPGVRLAGGHLCWCWRDQHFEGEHPAVQGETLAVVGQQVNEAIEIVVIAEQAAGDRIWAAVREEVRAVPIGGIGVARIVDRCVDHGAHPTYSEVELNVRLSSQASRSAGR